MCAFSELHYSVCFVAGFYQSSTLSADSKDTVRLGLGMIATMAALVLGLLVASAKNFYDTQSSELTQVSADVILLDRVLVHTGRRHKTFVTCCEPP